MNIRHLNPDSLFKSPAFSQGVLVQGGASLVFVGGQNGVNAAGELVGDSFTEQTEQACKNVLAVLESASATYENVVKMTIFVRAGSNVNEGFAAALKVFGPHPTAISVAFVPEFANSRVLVEIEAIAAVEAA